MVRLRFQSTCAKQQCSRVVSQNTLHDCMSSGKRVADLPVRAPHW